ncbi:hypothetical protein Q9189_008231 [Teloschistes chrysophthalmus]
MRGVLLASDLWVFIDDPSSRPEPPELKAKEDDSEERTERIWERSERRAKYFGYRNSCIGKIYRQCTFTGLINRLGDTVLRGDTEQDANILLSKCLDLQQSFASRKITVDELLSIMVLNQLPAQYDTIKKIKRNDAKNNDNVPSLQEIVETVKDDIKNRHQNYNVVNFAGKSRGGKTGGGGKKPDVPQCTFCKKQGHIENNCTKKYPERAEEIMQAVKEAKEQRQKKKEKEKSKNKDKGKGKETSDDKEENTKGA